MLMLTHLLVTSLMYSVLAADPPTDGLTVWLDADDPATLELDPGGRVWRWQNKAGDHHHATADRHPGPRVTDDQINGRAVLRFDGQHTLALPALADRPGGLTVFAVFRRMETQASDHKWQRIVSCWDGHTDNDTNPPSWFVDPQAMGKAASLRIVTALFSGVARGPMTIGHNQAKNSEFMRGDLAELLIYDREFVVDDQLRQARDYLASKWGIVEDPAEDWTRVGPLAELPERVSDKLPLSDQADAEGWRPVMSVWDEFEGEAMDRDKWHDHNPRWFGRYPAVYLPRNVSVGGGKLRLTMRREPAMPALKLYEKHPAYHSYSAASIVSKARTRYGYFEIQAKVMDSAGCSAWWFASSMRNPQGGVLKTEIDVFEIGGRSPGHEDKLHMNLHVFETPEAGKKHWNVGGHYKAPFDFADGFHVFGLAWTPEQIRYYLDGTLVRRVPNTTWHAPMFMKFDIETMPDWLSLPEDADLPSVFEVEYIRAWTNAATPEGDHRHWVDSMGIETGESWLSEKVEQLKGEPWYGVDDEK
jgi:beta-glucanase (GH16 family)